MKKSFLFVICLAVFTSLIISCDDEKGEFEATLTGGKWVLERLELNGEEVMLDECELKDSYVFNEDNTFVFTFNEQVSETDPCTTGTSSGIWREDNSVPNSIRIEAAFDGDDINDENQRLNFRIENQTLREIIKEPAAEGGFNSYSFYYKKQ